MNKIDVLKACTGFAYLEAQKKNVTDLYIFDTWLANTKYYYSFSLYLYLTIFGGPQFPFDACINLACMYYSTYNM